MGGPPFAQCCPHILGQPFISNGPRHEEGILPAFPPPFNGSIQLGCFSDVPSREPESWPPSKKPNSPPVFSFFLVRPRPPGFSQRGMFISPEDDTQNLAPTLQAIQMFHDSMQMKQDEPPQNAAQRFFFFAYLFMLE